MQLQTRIIIENVFPQLDGGKFSTKRIVGQNWKLTDVLPHGHDIIACSVNYKHDNDKNYTQVRMQPTENDRYIASFVYEK